MRKPVPLPDGSYNDLSRPWSQQDVCNYLPDIAEQSGTRSPLRHLSVPGLQESLVFGEDPHRGARNVEGKLFVVAGRKLWQGNPETGLVTEIGTVAGSGRVSITHNQIAGGNQVVIASSAGSYVYDTSTGIFGPITDSGFPGMIVCDFIAQLIVGLEPQRRYFFNSALADATDYNALESNEAESSPDRLRSILVYNNQLVAFGERTTEFYNYTGVTNALFERVTAIDVGCAGTHTVAKLDNRMFWVGHNGGVYANSGYQPVRISTVPLERALAQCDLSKAFAFVWEDQGRAVYYLTCPDGRTWGYDCSTRKWHRRESYGMDRWRLNTLVKWGDDWYGGSCLDGTFYRLDWNYWAEGADDLRSYVTTAIAHADQNRLTVHSLEPVFDTGGPAAEPASLFLSGDVPSGEVGEAVETAYHAGGERTLPLVYSITAGSLPPGVDMDEDGNVSGTYTLAGFYSWTVTVTDADERTASRDDTAGVISLTGDPPPGAVDEEYEYELLPEGGVEPYVLTITDGALPDGLSMDSQGVITGTPTTLETAEFTVQMRDAEGNTTSEDFSILIGEFQIVGDLPDGVVGDVVSYFYTAIGGVDPLTWSVGTGSLPDGLSLNASTGEVSGTRSASGTATFTIHCVDDDAQEDDLDDTSLTLGTFYLAAAENGDLATSEDAATWTEQVSGTGEDLNAAAVGDTALIVVGDDTGSGLILRSTDAGVTWVSRTTNVTCSFLTGVVYCGEGVFVAVGNSAGVTDGQITRSTDAGDTWAAATVPSGCGPLTAICRNPDGLLVAVSNSGRALVSSDNGVSWTKYTVNTGASLKSVCFNEARGLFMAVGSTIGGGVPRAYTSTTGVTWTRRSGSFPANGQFSGVCASGMDFIASAADHASLAGIWRSEDEGVTWTRVQVTANAVSACAVNGRVIVGDGASSAWVSDDGGDSWSEVADITSHVVNAVAGGLV